MRPALDSLGTGRAGMSKILSIAMNAERCRKGARWVAEERGALKDLHAAETGKAGGVQDAAVKPATCRISTAARVSAAAVVLMAKVSGLSVKDFMGQYS